MNENNTATFRLDRQAEPAIAVTCRICGAAIPIVELDKPGEAY